MSYLESHPNVEIVNETSKFSNMASNEANIELPIKSTCKYYLVKDFQHLNKARNNLILHSNINGIESKLENLHEFLSGTTNKMDVIALRHQKKKMLAL